LATFLVTGGAGYIGAHACRQLSIAGHRPIAFDNLSTGWRDSLRYGVFIEGDILNPADLQSAFAAYEFDAVIHFAARSQVGESMTNPELYWQNNLHGTLNLLEEMRRAGVRELVFSSTAAVYGDPDLEIIPETAPTIPSNPYGLSKLAAENAIADFVREHSFRTLVFRYFNVAGAARAAELGEQHRPETHLIPLAIESATGKRPAIEIFGTDYPTPDGTCIRDFIHVEDLVAAHLIGVNRLLDRRSEQGSMETYNLGIGRGYSVKEVIDHVRKVTGARVTPIDGPRRSGDAARLVCDSARVIAEFNWKPRRDIDAMIRDAHAWHLRGGFDN
jgi:UDP-glucose-4-epimerase GalE